MDLFFADPSEVPLPPAEVRIRSLSVDPYPDGRRLRVKLELDPFQKRPNLDLTLTDSQGNELSSAFIIQSMTRQMELVMHLRRPASGLLTLQVELYYTSFPDPVAGIGDPGSSDPDPVAGIADPGSSDPNPVTGIVDPGPLEIERQVVDTRQATFEIPV
jgi:hypothetical protein